MKKNLFIVLEGIDGSGKSTLINRLKSKDQFKNWKFIREPTDGPYGKEIRQRLKNNLSEKESDKLTRLFIEDRLWNNENVIQKLEKENYNIFCDRYYFSTAAYQGKNKKDVLKILIEQMENPRIKNPDYVFFLNIDVNSSLERIQKRNQEKEIFERKNLLLQIYNHYKIIEDYFNTSNEFELNNIPRWVSIDAKQSPEDIEKSFLEIIDIDMNEGKN